MAESIEFDRLCFLFPPQKRKSLTEFYLIAGCTSLVRVVVVWDPKQWGELGPNGWSRCLSFKTSQQLNWKFSLDPTGFVIVADLVVASAGDDKKISLWRKNGHSMGTIPMAGTDSGDNIEVI